jgi:Ca2+-binding RTX toxin-like protein
MVVGRYAPPSTDDQVSAAPDWSPDGTTIAFARFATAIDSRVNIRYALQSDLYEVPSGGGEAVRLTRTPNLSEGSPRFRPGGGSTPAGTRQECVLSGTAGPDVLRGTPRPDLVDAGPGNDAVYRAGGADVIDAGAGNDVVWGGTGRDELRGGPGNDTILARDHARDVIYGGPGRDNAWVDRTLDIVASVEVRH